MHLEYLKFSLIYFDTRMFETFIVLEYLHFTMNLIKSDQLASPNINILLWVLTVYGRPVL